MSGGGTEWQTPQATFTSASLATGAARGRLRRLARIVRDADGRRCGPEADRRQARGGRHPPAVSHRELPGALMRRFSHTSTQSAGLDANRKLPVTMSMSPS